MRGLLHFVRNDRMTKMKLALAQINTTVGDLEGNIRRVLEFARRAKDADLIAFPEMVVSGYPPRDILYDVSFVEAVEAATQDLAKQAKGLPPLLVGSFARSGKRLYEHPALYNIAYLMRDGEMQAAQVKQLLPVYDVFYEPRWFIAGEKTLPPIDIGGTKIGVIVCEDMWDEEYPIHPGAELKKMGADMLICMSASPYRRKGHAGRIHHARRQGLPIAFVNLVGGNDQLVFDGGGFALDNDGNEIKLMDRFEERVVCFNTKDTRVTKGEAIEEKEIFDALVLGIRDFARKNHLQNAFIGMSGGIDSSAAAVIAAEALGAQNVTGIAMPTRFTDARSTESARELAERLGMRLEIFEMENMRVAVDQFLGEQRSEGVGGENIQARLRMLILMSYVNQHKGFLVNTSNKTELTLGYSTLYGDIAGTISPLGDLTKTEVYELARWINSEFGIQNSELIPKFVLERKPSAELRENQVDPFDYDVVSPELEKLVLANQSNAAMRASEHKRWQMGIVLKVSGKSFGSGRLMPITRK